MTRIAYLDCFSGLSGDMLLGALLACGADETAFRTQLAGLRVSGYQLHTSRRKVEGLMATDVHVEVTDTDTGHGRHLSDIQEIYAQSDLPERVRTRALAVFTRLAEAEARVHGTTVDAIHFHEVGAVDSIVDITGACILLEMLQVEAVYSAPLPLSRGFVDCQHGRMPLPAPATMELLIGLPTYPVEVRGELVTPTGAAFVAALVGPRQMGNPPRLVPRSVGYGAGKKDWGAPFPNLLRIFIGDTDEHGASAGGEATDASRDVSAHAPVWPNAVQNSANADGDTTPQTVAVLETQVDDATPETLGYAQEQLLEAGALDVFFVSAQMKKNRPGTLVTVLAIPEQADALTDILLRETGTFGVRQTFAKRETLTRRWETVPTQFGAVRVKVGTRRGIALVFAPEYEDCRRLAAQQAVPLRDVYQAALWHQAQISVGSFPQ